MARWKNRKAGERALRYISPTAHPAGGDCHLLLWPSEGANPTQIMQRLEEPTAQFILKNLRQNPEYPCCQKMLARVTLPPSVHDHAHFRVWQRRLYDMNIWSRGKRDEKLNTTIPSSAAW